MSQTSLFSQDKDNSTVCINRSTSKQKFSFGKDDRFKGIKTSLDIHAYDHEGESAFSLKPDRYNQSSGFGSTLHNRFDY